MAGLTHSTVASRVQGVRFSNAKTAEIQTASGVQGVRLISADVAYEWALDDNRELAKAMSNTPQM